MNNYWKKIFSS